MHGDKEITGKTNTLQLGEPQAVTFPFTPTSAGLITVYLKNQTGGVSDFYLTQARAGNVVLRNVMTTPSETTSSGFVKKGVVVNKGGNATINAATFIPFLATTGEPVKQTYDPTSVEPISGAGVAAALSNNTLPMQFQRGVSTTIPLVTNINVGTRLSMQCWLVTFARFYNNQVGGVATFVVWCSGGSHTIAKLGEKVQDDHYTINMSVDNAGIVSFTCSKWAGSNDWFVRAIRLF